MLENCGIIMIGMTGEDHEDSSMLCRWSGTIPLEWTLLVSLDGWGRVGCLFEGDCELVDISISC
jgi:hypothetical protein